MRELGLRILRWAIWAMLLLVLVRGVFAIAMPVPPPVAAAPIQALLAEPDGLKTFPVLFSIEYLTWHGADGAERAKRLRPYLAAYLDSQAGVTAPTDGRRQEVTGAWVYSMQAQDSDRWLVTVAARVNLTLPSIAPGDLTAPVDPTATTSLADSTRPADSTATTAPADSTRPADSPSTTAPADSISASGSAQLLFLTVPVARVGAGWVVHDYPAFVAPPAPAASVEAIALGQKQTDEGGKIQALLASFFRAYVSGTAEEVTYFMLPGSSIAGLGGKFSELNLGEVGVYKKGDSTWALAEVGLLETVSGARYRTRYTLELEERDGRWYVKSLLQKGA